MALRVPCPTCHGTGRVVRQSFRRMLEDGPVMWGGPVPREDCQSCNGSGWVMDEATTLRPENALIPHDLNPSPGDA